MKQSLVISFILTVYLHISIAKNNLNACISCEKFRGNLNNPVALTSLDENNILIIEQKGNVLVYNSNNKSVLTLLNITDKVLHDSSRPDKNPEQRGLLGLAVNPKCFPKCNSFYLFYSTHKLIASEDHRSIVARYLIKPSNQVVEDKIILNVSQPSDISNGGQLLFDYEDNLYVTVGDSGLRSESLLNSSILGKILRINVVKEEQNVEIFASGFENPWRCSFAPKGLICGDVAVINGDRISIVSRGDVHGPHDEQKASNLKHKKAIHVHGEKIPSAVIGGVFHEGTQLPLLNNSFVYGDFISGSIHALFEEANDEWKSEKLKLCCNCKLETTAHYILSFGEDYLKNVYVLTRAKDNKSEGIVYKLIDLENDPCDGNLIKSGFYLVATFQFLLSMLA